jgi:hypothetical protein
VLPNSGLSVFHGHRETTRLFHYFLPRLIHQGNHILCLDGGNRFDPLLIARLARRSGGDPSQFDRHLRVARAFTCFQLTELLVRTPRLPRDFPVETLIVTALPDLYFDEDVREREAIASFQQAIQALRTLPFPVAVFSGADSIQTRRRRFFNFLRAQADQVYHFTGGEDRRQMLMGEKTAPQMASSRA